MSSHLPEGEGYALMLSAQLCHLSKQTKGLFIKLMVKVDWWQNNFRLAYIYIASLIKESGKQLELLL